VLSRAVALRRLEQFVASQDASIIAQLARGALGVKGVKYAFLENCPFLRSRVSCRASRCACPFYMVWRHRFPHYMSCAFTEVAVRVHGGGEGSLHFIMSELLLASMVMIGTVKADMLTDRGEQCQNQLP